jgi:hypothetical protein
MFVQQMIDLNKCYHLAKTKSDKELYMRQINDKDIEIDKKVYEIYGLSPEEALIVDNSFKK